MKKFFVLLLSTIIMVCTCSCGSQTYTYQFLNYSVPSGYTQDGTSEEPLYSNGEGYSLSIDIEQSESDYLTPEDMLNNRLTSSDDSEVTVLDDFLVDEINAKQYYTYYSDMDSAVLTVSFIYNESLVEISLLSYNAEIPDDILDDFEIFLNSFEIK